MTYQLVPPDDHQQNIAEKAIQIWKDHFIAVISGTDTKFPLHLWCQLLPQMEQQLCLLRQSNAYPHISSHTHLYGHHDYNAHPFVPLGMEALVHDKPHRRKSFAQHCTKGYVIGTSYEHYRCWKVWTPTSRTTRISATVFFKHKYITNPTVTPADAIIAAATNLSHLLTNNLQAHHNNKVKQTDLTRLQILTQPSPLHNEKPSTRHSPTAPLPSTLPAVSDYDSDSSDSDNESVTIPPPVPRSPPQPPRVPPQQIRTPLPRVSTSPTAPAYNTRSRVHTITQETILHLLHNTRTPLTPQQAAIQRFSHNTLSAILGTDTGELLENQHLIKNPMYRTIWKNAYGKELALGRHSTRHQHHSLHCTQPNTSNLPKRRGPILHPSYVWQQQNHIPWQLWHTYSGHANHQGSPQQHYLHQRCTIHDHRHQEFLLKHTNGSPRIHAPQTTESLHFTISTNLQPPTDRSMSLSKKACTVSHKQESLPSNYLNRDLPPKATDRAPSHQVSGNTTGAPSHSLYVSTTLE
eukprot:CCRYP_006820-RA/>CCRYP_006820-RA protein AED:0.33 eAED:0.33 QI:0/0/0/1/0/0/3/0/519